MILLIILLMGALGTGNAPAALIITALIIYRYRKPSRGAKSDSSAPPSVKPLTAAQVEKQREKLERQKQKEQKQICNYNIAKVDYLFNQEEEKRLTSELKDIRNQIEGANIRRDYESAEKLKKQFYNIRKQRFTAAKNILKAQQKMQIIRRETSCF